SLSSLAGREASSRGSTLLDPSPHAAARGPTRRQITVPTRPVLLEEHTPSRDAFVRRAAWRWFSGGPTGRRLQPGHRLSERRRAALLVLRIACMASIIETQR